MTGTVRWIVSIVLPAACCLGAAAGEPENLAPKAKVAASSEYDGRYLARFAVDGKVPQAEGKEDEHQAWCVRRDRAGDRGEFSLSWDKPVEVAEVVYFGRTGQVLCECFKDYELYLDSQAQPAARGSFKMAHGPQRIAIPRQEATRVRLKFLNSYGPYNPGASEIAVYSASPSDAQLARFEAAAAPETTDWASHGLDEVLVIHRKPLRLSHVYVYHAEGFAPGGGLYAYNPRTRAMRQIIDAGEGMIIDCDLSWDAREIVFSWKKTGKVASVHITNLRTEHDRTREDENYQVYRVNVDGTGLTRLTGGQCNNLNACWLPDGGVAFLSDRKPAYAYCFITTSPVLYRMERDGSKQTRLSSNYLMDFTPAVTHDGRILYTRWEYVDRPACPIQSLWTINPDGTGLAGFYGNRVLAPGTFMEAQPVPGRPGTVLALATNHNGDCRGGVVLIDPDRGPNARESVRNVTPEVDIYRHDGGVWGNGLQGPYETPYPLDDRRFLTSRQGELQLRDYEGKLIGTVLRRKGPMGYYSPRPLRPRTRPPVIASSLPEKPPGPWATVVLRDVYHGLEPQVKRGEIRRIAVVQEIEKSTFTPLIHQVPTARGYAANTCFGYQFPLVSCGATYAPKKVWGFADVAPDGSACFQVPTEMPIYFLALDQQGRAVQRMRTFTHLMPGEVQGCVGCHADRNLASSRQHRVEVLAAPRPAELPAPEWGRTGFSYSHIVQPVLDKHCVRCHNARSQPRGVDLSGDRTDFFSVSYDILARKGTFGEWNFGWHGVPLDSRKEGRSPYTRWIATINGAEYNILMTEPRTWGSPASKLADIILSGHPDAKGKPRASLDADQRQRVLTWIDLNVPYYHTSSSTLVDMQGCRRLQPVEVDAVLADVARRRCNDCHKQGPPRAFYTRITNVKDNSFLLAPLARAAGGTGACGKEVFASTDDADYQAILKAFGPIQEIMRSRPRPDMEPLADPACPLPPMTRNAVQRTEGEP